MSETAAILHNASRMSLVLLDEIGRGTSTYDGVAIAWAVAEFLHERGAKTVFATHYHELTQLADRLPRVVNCNVAVHESGDNVVFLHRLKPGGADRSYGIHVARLAGLPDSVIAAARQILARLEAGHRVATPADQLVLFLALSKGPSTFTTSQVSNHLVTHLHVVRHMLGTRFEIDGCVGKPGTVRLTP